MPIENDFLPFAAGGSANVETQSTWAADSVVTNGFASGTANSAQVNKALRQPSIIASMIAQFIADHSGQPAIDDGTTATLETNLLAAINAVITTFAANALGSGGTAYSPDFNCLTTAGTDLIGAALRIKYGNYGAMFRNDGTNLYILLTNSGYASGAWNSLRPITINLLTGAVTLDGTGAGSAFGGAVGAASLALSGAASAASLNITGSAAIANAALTGTPTAPTPASSDNSTKVATTAFVQSEFAASLGTNGYQKLANGLIIQWGQAQTTSGSVTLTFPIAFPSALISFVATDRGAGSWSTTNVGFYGASSQSGSGVKVTCAIWGGSAFSITGTGLFSWIAIGY